MKRHHFLYHWFTRHQLKHWEKALRRDNHFIDARKSIGLNSGDDSVLLDLGRVNPLPNHHDHPRER